jgi:hypothetical protein
MQDFGFGEDSQLCVEFFFYAPTEDSASNLAIELSKLSYTLAPVDKAAGDPSTWLVNGWTPKMSMSSATMEVWSMQMQELADAHECEFDGWGTLLEEGFDPANQT